MYIDNLQLQERHFRYLHLIEDKIHSYLSLLDMYSEKSFNNEILEDLVSVDCLYTTPEGYFITLRGYFVLYLYRNLDSLKTHGWDF